MLTDVEIFWDTIVVFVVAVVVFVVVCVVVVVLISIYDNNYIISFLLPFKRPMFPSYRNQSFDLLCKSTDWFLYHEKIGH